MTSASCRRLHQRRIVSSAFFSGRDRLARPLPVSWAPVWERARSRLPLLPLRLSPREDSLEHREKGQGDLSFLGLDFNPTRPSWCIKSEARRRLCNDGRSLIIAEGPELTTPPDQLQVTLEPVRKSRRLPEPPRPGRQSSAGRPSNPAARSPVREESTKTNGTHEPEARGRTVPCLRLAL
jgi:hypothetical protein